MARHTAALLLLLACAGAASARPLLCAVTPLTAPTGLTAISNNGALTVRQDF